MTKKLFIFMTMAFILPASALAASIDPMEGPVTEADPSANSAVIPDEPLVPPRTPGKFTIGAEAHLLFDKKMDPPEDGAIDTLTVRRSDQFYIVPAYNIHRSEKTQVDLFMNLGAGSMRITKANKGSLVEEDTSYDKGFLWAIGIKGSQKLWDNFTAHASMKYKSFESDIDEYTFNGIKAQQLSGDTKGQLSEFETAFLISAAMSPEDRDTTYHFYAGPSFTFTSYEQGAVNYMVGSTPRGAQNADSDQRSAFGLTLGFDILKFSEALRINAEGKLFSESSLTLSIHYNF